MGALAHRVTKDDRVDVRLQSHQKELLRDAAVTAGLTISAFLLSVGLREARKITTIKLNREEAATFAELLESARSDSGGCCVDEEGASLRTEVNPLASSNALAVVIGIQSRPEVESNATKPNFCL